MNNSERSRWQRAWQWLMRPKVLLALGGVGAAFALVLYIAIVETAKRTIPSIAERELEKILNRDVEVGAIERLSLGGTRLSQTTIPTAEGNDNSLTVERIDVRYQPLSLLRGRLPIRVTISGTTIEVAQLPDGSWATLNLTLPEPPDEAPRELPIDPRIEVALEDVKISVLPLEADDPLTIEVEALARVRDKLKAASYRADLAIGAGSIALQGETQIETLQSQLSLAIERFELTQFNDFLPQDIASLNGGTVNANLQIDQPAILGPEAATASAPQAIASLASTAILASDAHNLSNLDDILAKIPTVNGTLRLEDFGLDLAGLRDPVTAGGTLRFQGDHLRFDGTEAGVGALAIELAGSIDRKQGFDLSVAVPPVEAIALARPIEDLPDDLDLDALSQTIAAAFSLDATVTGAFDDPRLGVAFRNENPWRVDRLQIAEVRTNFTLDRRKFDLNGLRVAPAAGGRILARGEADVEELIEELVETLTAPPDASQTAYRADRAIELVQQVEPDEDATAGEGSEGDNLDLPLDTVELAGTLDVDLPLDAIAAPYELPPEIALGLLRAEAELGGNAAAPTGELSWLLAEISAFGEAIASSGRVSFADWILALEDSAIAIGGGQIAATGSADLNESIWSLRADGSGVDISALLSRLTNSPQPLNLGLNALAIDAGGTLPDGSTIWPTASGNLTLEAAIQDGIANLRAGLNDGAIDLVGSTSAIDLSAFTQGLPIAWRGSRFEAATTIDNLLAIAETQTIGGISLRGQADVGVGTGGVVADARIDGGRFSALARGDSIDLSALARGLGAEVPVAAMLRNLDATIDANLAPLLSALATGDPNVLAAALAPELRAELDLGIDDGGLAIVADANARQWSVVTDGTVPVSENLLATLTGGKSPITSPAFPRPARIDSRLSGSLAPILDFAATGNIAPIDVALDRVALALGQEFVNLDGRIRLRNWIASPDLDADINIAAEYDADRLPIVVNGASLAIGNREARSQGVNLAGAIDFDGRFVGRNLISDPLAPGSVDFLGDLALRNAAANDLVFDPLISGPTVVRTGDRLEIDLRGNRDRVAARLVPCERADCLIPILPDGFELRYGSGTREPVLALGERRDDRLDVSLENFQLDLLNIAPATKLGLEGDLQGNITAAFAVNLFDLSADGSLAIEQPGVGYLVTDSLLADFSYNDGTASLDYSEFNLGRTQYLFTGAVDLDLLDAAQGKLDVADIDAILATQVRGELTVDEGHLEDLFDLFKWSNIDDLTARQLASPSLNADDLSVTGIGAPDVPIPSQLPAFEEASRAVRDLATALRQPGPPRELDLRGTYDAQIDIGGTLGDPQVDLAFEADRWRWHLQPTINAIEPQLGFFREETTPLAIDNVTLAARYSSGILDIQEAGLNLDGAQLEASGQVSENFNEVVVRLDNLQLDTIRNFAPIPLDAAAAISLEAAIGGSFAAPVVTGDAIVGNLVLNSRPIDDITSRFDYADETFSVATTSPEWLDVSASAPLPLTPDRNTTTISAKLDTPALELLSTLSGGQVEYVSGDLDLDLEATIGFVGFFPQIEAVGQVILTDTTVRSPIFPEAPLSVTGNIDLAYDPIAQVIVDVDRLIASVAEGEFAIDGTLPLYPSREPIETPLTFSVAQGELDLDGFYRGQVDGNIQIANSALRPVISGRIGVEDGRVTLPRLEEQPQRDLLNVEAWEPPPSNAPPPVQPTFDNFTVFIGEDFRAELEPLFNFRVQGEIVANGTYDGTLDRLQTDGAIEIERGRVNVLSNLFFIAPGSDHFIRFDPDRSPIDPFIDITLATLIYENESNRLRQRDPGTNELPDLSIIPNRRSRQILVELGLDGSAQELLAAVQDSNNGDEDALLEVVTLTSVPSREEQVLVSMLGNQLLTTVDDIAQLQGAEFLEFAALRFAIEPTLTNVLLDADNIINNAGRALGLTRLSAFPPGQLEGTVQLTPDSLLRLTYDYGWNGLQLRNSGSEETAETPTSVELRYEFRF